MKCDILILGGGTGGCAAAIALAESGLSVVMTEPTDWIGGQLTSQAVPPDEHPWIEQCGRTETYATYRRLVREYTRESRDLSPVAKSDRLLNPGSGWVSALCHEPSIGVAVLHQMLERAKRNGLKILHRCVPVASETVGDRVNSVTVSQEGKVQQIEAKLILDCTELGDFLPMAGIEYTVGAESKSETHEPNAIDGPAEPDNVQGITWCAILGYDPTGDHTIDRPRDYAFWRSYQPKNWPVPLLSFQMYNAAKATTIDFPLFENGWFNLFSYRQIIDPELYRSPAEVEAATVMNWPQNDYYNATIIDVPEDVAARRLEESRQLTLSFIYWLQTEQGYPGIRLRPDLAGTPDGLAMAPYIRESRRIQALTTVCEQDVAAYTNPDMVVAPPMRASVGIGAYRIDLHPSTNERPSIDTSTLPFQIPMGALIPRRVRNVLAGCKNLGVTHITNGCYRLHPVEWNIGESAGLLAAFCLLKQVDPVAVWESEDRVKEFQRLCIHQGIPIEWPQFRPL